MAHKKGLGSSRNGRDSNPQMLGVKIFAGQTVTGGEIIDRVAKRRGRRAGPQSPCRTATLIGYNQPLRRKLRYSIRQIAAVPRMVVG